MSQPEELHLKVTSYLAYDLLKEYRKLNRERTALTKRLQTDVMRIDTEDIDIVGLGHQLETVHVKRDLVRGILRASPEISNDWIARIDELGHYDILTMEVDK